MEVYDATGSYVDITPYDLVPRVGGPANAFDNRRYRNHLRLQLSGEPAATNIAGSTIVALPYDGLWTHVHPVWKRNEDGSFSQCDIFSTDFALKGTLYYEFVGGVRRGGVSMTMTGQAIGTPDITHPTVLSFHFGSMSPFFPLQASAGPRWLGGEQGEPPECEGFSLLHGIDSSESQIYERVSNGYTNLTGTVRGQLRSAQPTLTTPPNAVHRAQVMLSRLKHPLRSQLQSESDADYLAYRREALSTGTAVGYVTLEPSDEGRFTFDSVSLGDIDTIGEVKVLAPAYYLLEVTAAATERPLLVNGQISPDKTETLFFAKGEIHNVVPVPPGPEPSEPLVITLQAIEGIPAKERLIRELTEWSTNHYAPIESRAQARVSFLKAIADGEGGEITEAELEGLNRALWAERLMVAGADNARLLLDPFAKSLANIFGDLVEELAEFIPSGVSRSRQRYDNFGEALDFSALERKGWKWTTANETEQFFKDQMERVLEQHPELLLSEVAKILKYGIKLFAQGIQTSFVLGGMGDSDAAGIANNIKVALMGACDVLIHQGPGMFETLAKTAVEKAVEEAKVNLFDNSTRFSYTGQTAPFLDLSTRMFETWDRADKSLYDADVTSLYETMRRMTEETTDANYTLLYQLAFADAFDIAEGGLATAGRLVPQAKLYALIAKGVKYLNNLGVTANAFLRIYVGIPNDVEIGTHYIFGRYAPAGLQKQLSPSAAAMPSVGRNRELMFRLRQALAQLQTSSSRLSGELNADNMPNVIIEMNPENTSGYRRNLQELRKAYNLVIAEASGAKASGSSQLNLLEPVAGRMIDLQLQAEQILTQAPELVIDSVVRYASPADPEYVASRNELVADLNELLFMANEHIEKISLLHGEITSFTPLIEVTDLKMASDSTSRPVASRSPETFTVTARVVNLSVNPLNNLSALLKINSPKNSVSVNGSALTAIPNGTLAGEDFAAGSGPDEANLTWSVTFSGNLAEPESIVLTVDLLEQGQTPQNFDYFSDSISLPLDTALLDPDLDGTSSRYEIAHGLNPNLDDRNADLDNDGLTNFQEYRLRTAPNDPDTDNDGVTDGKEISGDSNGYVTDPLLADSDGDGIRDDLDLQPGNALSSNAAPASEPVISASPMEIVLTEEKPFAIISVNNVGNGKLVWAAAANPSLLIVPGGVMDAPQFLVSASKNFTFQRGPAVESRILIMDLGGQKHDSVEVRVFLAQTPTLRLSARKQGQQVLLTLEGQSGQTYNLLQNSDLGSTQWTTLQSIILTDRVQNVSLPLSQVNTFLRLQKP